MKALILAAGLGTRLRPLTDTIPKPLVPIGGKPLLAYHFDSLRKHHVNDVCINTHYLADQIEDFVQTYTRAHPDFHVKIYFEPTLLGSAGTLLQVQDFFQGESDILVLNSDNLTTIDYEKLFAYHHEKGGIATIASYYEQHPETKGIIVFDTNNRIQSFIEKPRPEQVVSHIANGGVYVYTTSVFDYVARLTETPADIGKHLLPLLLGADEAVFSYQMSEFLLDIGTLDSYRYANEIIHTLSF